MASLILPEWLELSQTSGSGTKTISMTAAPNYGRTGRSFTLLYKALNCQTINQSITQNGAGAFVSAEQTSITIANNVTELVLRGTSNCKRLYFTLGTGADTFITIPTFYTANGTQARNENASAAYISGDPGATIGFEWSIRLTITPNQVQTTKQRQVVIQGIVDPDEEGGQIISTYETVDITQSGFNAQLSISPAAIEFASTTNLTREVTVTSNTDWYIEG